MVFKKCGGRGCFEVAPTHHVATCVTLKAVQLQVLYKLSCVGRVIYSSVAFFLHGKAYHIAL